MPARSANACAICERPAFPIQTKRTFSAGNGRLRDEDELGPRRAAEREGKRLDRLGDEPIEEERPALARDFDQASLAQDLEVVGDRGLREPEGIELADAGLVAGGQTVDDREPRRICKRLEAGRQLLELLRLERMRAGRAAGDR